MNNTYTSMETAPIERIRAIQQSKFLNLLSNLKDNLFYMRKFEEHGVDVRSIRSLEDIRKLPFTYKREFQDDQANNPPFGTNLSEPMVRYVRYHQTSGTTGLPIRWLDTKESWEWRGKCAAMSMWASGVRSSDIVFFAFAFGPHVAFWGLFEGAFQIGALPIAGGGWDTLQRVRSIIENKATVVCCTPTYAMRLAEVAKDNDIDLRSSAVRLLIHGGEPGGLVPSIQKVIGDAWGATPYDYPGLTEVGAYGLHCQHQRNAVHVNESEFIIEVIDTESGEPSKEGQIGEMVLTNLGRAASPGIRFRTGDLVRLTSDGCACGRTFRLLEGGVLGRSDDMITIRGINVYPSQIGILVQKYLLIGEEYQVVAYTKSGMGELKVCVEVRNDRNPQMVLKQLSKALRDRFEIRIDVEHVPANSLRRAEYKSRRFADERVDPCAA